MSDAPVVIHVVDDDAAFRTAISRVLSASGFRVALYGSAQQLLDARPVGTAAGCILLDVQMSGLGDATHSSSRPPTRRSRGASTARRRF